MIREGQRLFGCGLSAIAMAPVQMGITKQLFRGRCYDAFSAIKNE